MRSHTSLVAALALASCGGTERLPVEPSATIVPEVPLRSDRLPPELAGTSGPSGTSQAVLGADRYDAVGYASWYGEELAGNRTASGEPFDAGAIAAAHRTLPLGSFAEVTALDTGRTIVVRINDRGPGRPDREIDLTRGAAQALGTDRGAVSAVRVRSVVPASADAAALRAGQPAGRRLDAPPALLAALRQRLPAPLPTLAAAPSPKAERPAPVIVPDGRYAVQVAAFSGRDRALALAQRLGGAVRPVGALFRVRLGPYASRAAAERARDGAVRAGYGDATVQPAE